MDLRNLIPFGRKNIAVKHENEHPFMTMQREMNRIFDSFSRAWESADVPGTFGSFTPRMDMTENAKAFTVTTELPGMDEQDIDLSISGDMLTIRGEKKEEKEEKNKNYYFSERFYGSFSRTIPLPRQVDTEKVTASFKKGILTVTLPKTQESDEEAKKITVRSE